MNPGRNAAHQKENFEQDPGILRILQEPCRLFTSYPTHLPNLGGSSQRPADAPVHERKGFEPAADQRFLFKLPEHANSGGRP